MHFNKLPFGIDPIYDIKNILTGYDLQIIVDVGANIGQSASSFLNHFPAAVIHCIEPVEITFRQLQQNTKKNAGIFCHNIALGKSDSTEQFKIPVNEKTTRISLIAGNEPASESWTMQTVNIKTLTRFCQDEKLSHIDYLKIDTEGYDLDVLKGGNDLLAEHAIGLIEIEAGMNPGNTLHVNIFSIAEYLEARKYFLFGIYEQAQEWKQNKPVLRRSNLLFISQQLAEKTNNNNAKFNRIDKCGMSES